ncbi:nuclear transport factor 2 family protein [Rhodococcus kronopolitis]|uniref:Nuclear transport factor 2 family protein n=1 Tax=Rhodococcus kronopolitis TaxID=1460226 RepID=A0ABV9FT67_9NOCA
MAARADGRRHALIEQLSKAEWSSLTSENADTVVQLLTAYISLWNERDPAVRRAIGSEVFTPDVLYSDPNISAEGRPAIDTYVSGWQLQFTDTVFRLGEVRSHHNLAHFYWSFGPPSESPVADGWDVVVLEHGRISRIYGFFR